MPTTFDEDKETDAFQEMSDADKISAIFEMMRFVRGRVAVLHKRHIELEDDFRAFARETRQYRKHREEKENPTEEDINKKTFTGRVLAILTKRDSGKFDAWVWGRDKILPPVLLVVLLKLLQISFSK